MAYRWLFERGRVMSSQRRHRKLFAEMRCDATRCVASDRVGVRGAQQGDKRQINVSSLRATPLVHTVIRDSITRARTRARSRDHTCARGCGRNYSRCTGYNWRARVDVTRTRSWILKSARASRRDARRPTRNKSTMRLWLLNMYTRCRAKSAQALTVDLELRRILRHKTIFWTLPVENY